MLNVLPLLLLALPTLSLSLFAPPTLSAWQIAQGARAVAASRSFNCPVIYTRDPPLRASAPAKSPRIINGDAASAAVAPSVIAWYETYGTYPASFLCTGTLISPRWVITAAHCIRNPGRYAAVLLLRNTDMQASTPGNENFTVMAVERTVVHPNYRADDTPYSQQHDIAAVLLASPAPAAAVPMLLNVNPDIPLANTFIRVLGFGVTVEGDDSVTPRSLAQVDIPVTPTKMCAKLHENVPNVEIRHGPHVCVGYPGKGRCGSCSGDSGGPLIQYTTSGAPVLVAVVSAAVGCAHPRYPGVNIRIAHFHSWLDSVGVQYTAVRETNPEVFHDGEDGDGMSTGAVLGIVAAVVGGLLAATLVVLSAVFVMRRKGAGKEVGEDIPPGDGSDGAPQFVQMQLPGAPMPQQLYSMPPTAPTKLQPYMMQPEPLFGYGGVPPPPPVLQTAPPLPSVLQAAPPPPPVLQAAALPPSVLQALPQPPPVLQALPQPPPVLEALPQPPPVLQAPPSTPPVLQAPPPTEDVLEPYGDAAQQTGALPLPAVGQTQAQRGTVGTVGMVAYSLPVTVASAVENSGGTSGSTVPPP